MAKSFGQYTGGIEASTGNLVQASTAMAKQTYDTIAGIGQNLAEGLKAYNDNSQKSEAANAKIQMLGQEYADVIAMYSKDPEIAQSGILDGLIETGNILTEAPTKGFAQRAQIAMGAEAKLASFGGRLQEMMFLRGREMERVSEEALRRFAGFKSVTSAAFVGDAEFQVDLNLTPQEAQAQALAKLGRIRNSNPNLKGTDEEFLSAWRTAREQALANAKDVNPSVVSAGLEALASERRNAKAQADAQKKNDISGLLSSKFFPTEAPAVGGAFNLPKFAPDAQASGEQPLFLGPVGKTVASLKDYENTVVSPVDQIYRKENPSRVPTEKEKQAATNIVVAKKNIAEIEDKIAALTEQQKEDSRNDYFNKKSSLEASVEKTVGLSKKLIANEVEKFLKINTNKGVANVDVDIGAVIQDVLFKTTGVMGMVGQGVQFIDKQKSSFEKDVIKSFVADISGKGATNSKEKIEALKTELSAERNILAGMEKVIEPKKPKQTVAPIPLERFQIGTEEKEMRLTVADRQREVADFVTSRMGAIDPTDPERKRRLPVVGFDKFYKSLVPESEIREFTTDSGVRMLYANGKWEQIKADTKMTPAEMRKANIGVFGKQTADGRLVPSEFIPDSGVYIGGLFKGSDGAVDKYQEEMPKLIDARRGVRVLREINDQMGESLSPTAQGRALVEEMNLSAMLRTDIVGVGTVSNYEQQLIKRVTENSTNFFSLESKDRAILVALAERVDRRIKNLSASYGLTVEIRDNMGVSKYQALREQYLREKGIL